MNRTTYATLLPVYGKFQLVPKIDVNPVACLFSFEASPSRIRDFTLWNISKLFHGVNPLDKKYSPTLWLLEKDLYFYSFSRTSSVGALLLMQGTHKAMIRQPWHPQHIEGFVLPSPIDLG
jgi:hypothetical protein